MRPPEPDDHRDDPADKEPDGRDLEQSGQPVRDRQEGDGIVQGAAQAVGAEVAGEVRAKSAGQDGAERHQE